MNSAVHQNIIETAARLFYNQGYNLTGINEIIREAGIAKATLYNHFRSKEDICIAYLRFKDENFNRAIRNYLEPLPNGPEKLLGLFDFLLAFYNDADFNGCWCLNTISELPPDNTQIRTEIKAQKQALIRFIKMLVKEYLKVEKEAAAEARANQLYLLYEGALVEAHLHRSPWPIQTAKEIVAVLLSQ